MENEQNPESLITWLTYQKPETLATVWSELNKWNWPSAIPEEYKPSWWGAHEPYYNSRDRQTGFNDVVMAYCYAVAGEALISKHWRLLTRIKKHVA